MRRGANIYLNVKRALFLCASVLLPSLICSAGRADLTVTATAKVDGLPVSTNGSGAVFPLTYKTYFHGDKSRIEVSDGSVYIIDTDQGTVSQLDNKLNLVRRESIKNLESMKDMFPKNDNAVLSIDRDLNTGESIDTAKYFGTLATDVPVAGYAHITRTEPFNAPEPAGHRSGNGSTTPGQSNPVTNGVSGSGHFDSIPSPDRIRIPSYDVSGDLWVSPKYKLPHEKRGGCLPIALQLIWGGTPLEGQLADILGGLQELPLHAQISVKQSYSESSESDSAADQENSITTTFDVTSVLDSDVSETLFDVPANYTFDPEPVNFPQLALTIEPDTASDGSSQ